MKTLILAATLIAATGAVAAAEGAPAETSPRQARTQTAQGQFAAGDFGEAQKSLEAALVLARTDAEKIETLTQLGLLFENQERYDEARAAYERALPLVADAPAELAMTRLLIASTYVNQKKWRSAADSWAQLLEKPATPQLKATYQLGLAQAYMEMNQPDKARLQLEQLRAQMAPIAVDAGARPDERGFALIAIGRSYQTQNELEGARINFEAVAQIGEASNELRVNALKSLAEIAQSQNREADAQSALADARQLLANEASGYFAAKDWDGAAALYREALQTGVPDAVSELSIRWQLGNVLREQDDIDGARAEFMRVTEIETDNSKPMLSSLQNMLVPFSYDYLARGYIAQGKFDLARAALNSELALPNLQASVRAQAEALLKSLD